METATPMLKQYHAIKGKHQDCILLFHLGDFYEMFYDDARTAARVLDLVLTARGKGTPHTVPMCGFPHHASDNYIARLIKAGHKVAICEQLEDPALAKGLVQRDVTRVITSGTYLDESNSSARYLLSVNINGKWMGVAFTDPSSGTIQTNEYPLDAGRLIQIIARLPVYECIFPESAHDKIKDLFKHPFLSSKNISLSRFEDWCFNPDIVHKSLCEHFSVRNLRGFGIEGLPAATASAGALLEYLKQMNKQPLKHIDKIALYTDDNYCFISPAAHRGLELDLLIKTLDLTRSPLGRRQFAFWMTHPLLRPQDIIQRQEAVKILKSNPDAAEHLKKYLSLIPDIEKTVSRLSCGYTHAKDLLAVRNTLALIPEIKKIIDPFGKQNPLFMLDDIAALREHLELAVNEDIPLSNPEGKIISKGYHSELDELRGLQENGRQWLKKLQEEEIRHTGIHSLKIGFNKVFGYYIEVTKTNLDLVPKEYIRKQTLVNAERFITPELKEYEEKILTAQDKILKIEQGLVQKLKDEILNEPQALHQFCARIAALDAIYSLAKLTEWPGYVCPSVSADTHLQIKDGRHPIVEKTSVETFVANDTSLDCDENHLIILTGPNMSGKSTYIRQTAILTIMAQAGSFIPASSAQIGIVDKIFTRIGAHDDISKGQSTFMVEMTETADILNNLTGRSLVILDEIGRGTSTCDGLSLAWALAEHFGKTKARTLFATHFHELTALADGHAGVKNYNVAVKEWKEEIIFMHKILPGSSDDSYGIYVAKLAGIPKEIIHRSKQILTQLELQANLKEKLKGESGAEEQLSLFAAKADPVLEQIKSVIEAMDINRLTPLEALNELQNIKIKIENIR
ncbi:MAG: DNA mismatch repair protein MutS [Candidatus Omnitrophica bacterium]|nr:DNA mismatch repair protein MutS [Candidatus Omnitrophota bacterium]